MAILVIGAGLVGSQIGRILAERGGKPVLMDRALQVSEISKIVSLDKVTLVSGDILKPLSLSKIIIDHDIDQIVHMAANPMLTVGAQNDPFSAVELNIFGTLNVLEAARVHKIERVVVASSTVLNHFMKGGEGQGDKLREEAYPRPSTFYATTKQSMENLGLNYCEWFGVDFAALRFAAVVGPWGHAGGGGPTNIIRDALVNAHAGREALIPENGLEWVYSKDAARSAVMALDAHDLGSRIFNISMGYVCPAEDLANAIKSAVPGAKVIIATPKVGAISMPQMIAPSDLTLAARHLGFKPEFEMEQAVIDLSKWMVTNGALTNGTYFASQS